VPASANKVPPPAARFTALNDAIPPAAPSASSVPPLKLSGPVPKLPSPFTARMPPLRIVPPAWLFPPTSTVVPVPFCWTTAVNDRRIRSGRCAEEFRGTVRCADVDRRIGSGRCVAEDSGRQIPRALSEIRKKLKMEIEALEVVSGTLPRLNAGHPTTRLTVLPW
jgi:hypothetical protein